MNHELFFTAWPIVSSWLRDQYIKAINQRRLRNLRMAVFNAWVEEAQVFPPPLVSSSDDDWSSGVNDVTSTQALKPASCKFRNLRWFMMMNIALMYWSRNQEETMGHAVKNNSWFIMHDDSVIQFNLGTNWAITMTSTHTCGWGALAEGDKPYLYKDVAMPRNQNKIQSPKVPEGYSLCDVPAPRSARSQPNDVFSTGFRDLVCSCLPMLHHMIWWASQRFHISFSNLVVEKPE